MSITIEGIYLRSDFSEFITEKFAARYGVNLREGWIQPFGYYNQAFGSVICNDPIPDGTYLLVGKVEYPGSNPMTRHVVMQFNLVKSLGSDLKFAKQFNPYIDKPTAIPLTPSFPMFKVGGHVEYNKVKSDFLTIDKEQLTTDEIKDRISKLASDSILAKIYSLKLALLREMYREK